MAGALVSATYTINAEAPKTLIVSEGAVELPIDMVATHSSIFPHCSTDRKTILLSRFHISTADEEGAVKTKTIWLARDIHKMMHCNNPIQARDIQLDANTTLAQFFNAAKPISFGFWMPNRHDGLSAFVATDLSGTQLDDLISIGIDLKVGLRMRYTDGGMPQTRYIDVPDSSAHAMWLVPIWGSARVAHYNEEGLVPSSVSPANARYVSAELISLEYMASKVLDRFGLTISDIDASTNIEIAPFVYVGPTISGFSGSAPASYGLLSSIDDAGATYWKYTQERVAGESDANITMSVDSPYNKEVFDGDDYGWLGNFDSGVATDTTINVQIGTT